MWLMTNFPSTRFGARLEQAWTVLRSFKTGPIPAQPSSRYDGVDDDDDDDDDGYADEEDDNDDDSGFDPGFDPGLYDDDDTSPLSKAKPRPVSSAGLGSGTGPVRSQLDRSDLLRQMKDATTYHDWLSAASALDKLDGNDGWKDKLECADYDYSLVQYYQNRLLKTRESGDLTGMVGLIRTSLIRSLGGIAYSGLYSHSHVGTKSLIDRYIAEVGATLDAIVGVVREKVGEVEVTAPVVVPGVPLQAPSAPLIDIPDGQPGHFHSATSPALGPGLASARPKDVLDQVAAASHAFGRSALLLSGGGTFGMTHIGVVHTLWEHGLLPRIISGTSAGSIVAAVLCSQTDAELPTAITGFLHGELDVFVQAGSDRASLFSILTRILKHGVVFDVGNLVRVMSNLLGDLTFQEAYNRTRRILNVTVSSEGVYEGPRILNYVTSPDVVIWSAVVASCAVPLFFASASLLSKHPRTGELTHWDPSEHRWIDGSVDNDLPISRLAELFNVNHFIVSQVNPHVAPFLSGWTGSGTGCGGSGWANTLGTLARTEIGHRLHMLVEMGWWPTACTKLQAIINQRYSGDITILPHMGPSQLTSILRNPTPEFMERAVLIGRKATWPEMSRIRNHCAIEIALERTIRRLRVLAVCSATAAFKGGMRPGLTRRLTHSGFGTGHHLEREEERERDEERRQRHEHREHQGRAVDVIPKPRGTASMPIPAMYLQTGHMPAQQTPVAQAHERSDLDLRMHSSSQPLSQPHRPHTRFHSDTGPAPRWGMGMGGSTTPSYNTPSYTNIINIINAAGSDTVYNTTSSGGGGGGGAGGITNASNHGLGSAYNSSTTLFPSRSILRNRYPDSITHMDRFRPAFEAASWRGPRGAGHASVGLFDDGGIDGGGGMQPEPSDPERDGDRMEDGADCGTSRRGSRRGTGSGGSGTGSDTVMDSTSRPEITITTAASTRPDIACASSIQHSTDSSTISIHQPPQNQDFDLDCYHSDDDVLTLAPPASRAATVTPRSGENI